MVIYFARRGGWSIWWGPTKKIGAEETKNSARKGGYDTKMGVSKQKNSAPGVPIP